ncbi:MAG: caspase family protein [Spirochaeta sp.]|nr:caspase family protein [Spirochaeta sp.]
MTAYGARRAVLTLTLFLCVLMLVSGQDAGVRRFALFVGANDGGDDRVTLRYAVSDAARVADVMFNVGGVQPRDARLLRDPDGATIDRTVEWIARETAQATEDVRRVEFLFYYSGHSDEQGLLLGNERYEYRELRRAIESVQADVTVALLDSCSSGSFTRLKGGYRGQPFLIHDTADMTGYAFLTSSSDNEASQESDEIGASFFTHYLASGLLGAADTTRDGRVTLNEAYQYAFTETLARTTGTFAGPQHPAYEIQLTGAGDLILTDLAQANSGIRLEPQVSGRVYIREDDRGRIMAEFEKYRGDTLEIAVPAGRYRVELRNSDGMAVTPVTAVSGGPTVVAATDFSSMRLERNRIRGGGPDEDGSLARIRDTTVDAVDTVGRVAAAAFTGGDPGSPHFVSADRSTLVREPLVIDVLPGTRLVPGESVPEGESVHHLVFGILAAESGYTDGLMLSMGMNIGTGVTRGIEASYLGNIRRGRVHGVQQGTVFNIHSGEIRGVQGSSVFNITDGNVWGVQGAGVFNVVDGEIRGIQGSGFASIAGYAVRGVQWGGAFAASPRVRGVQAAGVTVARDVRGAQLGAVNVADSVRGAQIGVINLANEVDGITLGVLNLIRFGIHDVSLTLDDRGGSWLAFQHGTNGLYTIYQFGLRQGNLESNSVEVSSAAGLGTRIWSGTIYLDADMSAMVQGPRPQVFPSFRLSGGLRLGRRFALVGGVRFDGLLRFNGQERAGTHSGGSFTVFGDGVEVFPHVFGGIKI